MINKKLIALHIENYKFKIRHFLIGFFVNIARRLGGDVRYDGLYVYVYSKEIPIKDLNVERTENWDSLDSHDPEYDWQGLHDSVKKYGLKNPIIVVPVPSHEKGNAYFKYSIRDGFHRTKLFECMYGKDASVPCYILGKYGDVYRNKGFNYYDLKKEFLLAKQRIKSKTYKPSSEQLEDMLKNKQLPQKKRKKGDKKFSELWT